MIDVLSRLRAALATLLGPDCVACQDRGYLYAPTDDGSGYAPDEGLCGCPAGDRLRQKTA